MDAYTWDLLLLTQPLTFGDTNKVHSAVMADVVPGMPLDRLGKPALIFMSRQAEGVFVQSKEK